MHDERGGAPDPLHHRADRSSPMGPDQAFLGHTPPVAIPASPPSGDLDDF